jgi:hypothetical protein
VLIPKMLGTLPGSLTSQTIADPDMSSRQRFESRLQQLLNTTCAQTPIAATYLRTCHGQGGSSIAMMFALLAMWGAVSWFMLDIQRPPSGANGKHRVPDNKHIFDMHFVLAPIDSDGTKTCHANCTFSYPPRHPVWLQTGTSRSCAHD